MDGLKRLIRPQDYIVGGANMKFKIHRNVDVLRLRKVVIELFTETGELIDRRRCFSFPLVSLDRRLERKKRRMLRCAEIMQAAAK